MDGHILTLGDSVFDNTVYLESEEKDGEAWRRQQQGKSPASQPHTFAGLKPLQILLFQSCERGTVAREDHPGHRRKKA